MTRHLRLLIVVCPTALLALCAPAIAQTPARSGLDDLQQVAAARGAEALDGVEAISRGLFPKFEPEGLALMVVQPGRWAVLLNHPAPPSGFAPASGIERRKIVPEDPDPAPWSVHVSTAPGPWEDLPRPALVLEEVPTAVVRFNEVSIPANAAGWPPAEAVITRMVGALWVAHRAAVEGPRPFDVMPWRYQAGAEYLALMDLEQRCLVRMGRIPYTEKTKDEYERHAKEWLAIRKARQKMNPEAFGMEEDIEGRQGMADYMESAPFRTVDNPGAVQVPVLERVDPFFEHYKNFFALRVNMLNFPLLWSAADPAAGLAQARARGRLLPFAGFPIVRKWNEILYPEAGKGPRGWTSMIEAELFKDSPADPNTEQTLVEEVRRREGYDRLLQVIRAEMTRLEGAVGAETPAGLPLAVHLDGRPVLGYEAWEGGWTWAGPGRVEVAGPLFLKFDGGELAVGRDGRVAFEGAAGGKTSLRQVRLVLPAEAKVRIGGKDESLTEGRRGKPRQGDGIVMAPGIRLVFTGGRLAVAASGATLDWPPGEKPSVAR
jgi:hypothetical protein